MGDEGLNGEKSEAVVSLEEAMRQYDEASTAGCGCACSGARAGIVPFTATSTFRTAGCGPACPVVWQGTIPYADYAAWLSNRAIGFE